MIQMKPLITSSDHAATTKELFVVCDFHSKSPRPAYTTHVLSPDIKIQYSYHLSRGYVMHRGVKFYISDWKDRDNTLTVADTGHSVANLDHNLIKHSTPDQLLPILQKHLAAIPDTTFHSRIATASTGDILTPIFQSIIFTPWI